MVPYPPKVFVSYAHSTPEHNQRVADLVGTLRAKGLTVAVDSDVKTPQGPEEGWPKWMKRQLKWADWVLIFFDQVYRRRFDGEEEPDKGLGATWEGAIITHKLYRESVRNTQFIPLLGDEASTRLIPDELFGATYYRIPKQSGDLATALAQTVGTQAEAQATGSTQPAAESQAQIAPTRLRRGAERLFGREKELGGLDEAWNDPAKHVLTIVAWGGVGKTALVVEWMARQSAAGWPSFERVFDWSFYSQGTREQGAASADPFIAKALEFFGDKQMAESAASPWDKGARLAQLVAQRRALLVLDGIEPLQYSANMPDAVKGRLKDPALEALLKGLAQQNPGLCLVTTREHVTDLAPFRDTTAPEWDLENLSEEAGAALLHQAGATRAGAAEMKPDDSELLDASREVQGHALTLRLLGTYLAKAHGGDIRKRDRVKFDQADAKTQGGHAFKTMAAYEKWLGEGGEDGQRALAVLRLLGLFDRPADGGCLAALRREPPIPHLTEPLVGLDEEDWNLTVSFLADCGLVSITEFDPLKTENWELKTSLDAHPLIREYFAKQLREKNPEAWRAAHRRLYEHLTGSTEHRPDTLEGLQPLYQAVAHGCQAGLQQEACVQVYRDRILRSTDGPDAFYSTKKLGASGADLGAISCFFEQAWRRISPALSEADQAWLLNEAATRLSALGRLTEALEPMRAGMELATKRSDWENAASGASNLSELELTLGQVPDAVHHAQQSVDFADRTGDASLQMISCVVLGDSLQQAGRRADALARFREAEAIQAERQAEYPLLYSLQGFQYCDLLLGEAERGAWKCGTGFQPVSNHGQDARATLIARCREVEQRAAQVLKWAEVANGVSLLDFALNHLTLGRAALYRAVLTDSKSEQVESLKTARQRLTHAVDGLRRSASQDHIPGGLLSRAWLRYLEGDPDGSGRDLDEAWQIAERGPMRLFMADIHLHRARLFHAVKPYPWQSPKDDLAEARKLIDQCGYHRRDEELADAEQAAKSW
jgi:tetratricopeptide (TPR) repeat protein